MSNSTSTPDSRQPETEMTKSEAFNPKNDENVAALIARTRFVREFQDSFVTGMPSGEHARKRNYGHQRL